MHLSVKLFLDNFAKNINHHLLMLLSQNSFLCTKWITAASYSSDCGSTKFNCCDAARKNDTASSNPPQALVSHGPHPTSLYHFQSRQFPCHIWRIASSTVYFWDGAYSWLPGLASSQLLHLHRSLHVWKRKRWGGLYWQLLQKSWAVHQVW